MHLITLTENLGHKQAGGPAINVKTRTVLMTTNRDVPDALARLVKYIKAYRLRYPSMFLTMQVIGIATEYHTSIDLGVREELGIEDIDTLPITPEEMGL